MLVKLECNITFIHYMKGIFDWYKSTCRCALDPKKTDKAIGKCVENSGLEYYNA